MSRTYFRGASGCVIMFDVTRRPTFENVRVWKEDLDTKVVLPSGSTIPCILVANKVLVAHDLYCYVSSQCDLHQLADGSR